MARANRSLPNGNLIPGKWRSAMDADKGITQQTEPGIPVLALHCSGSSGAQWRSLQARLGVHYRVIAPDLFGYGAAAAWCGRGAFSLAEEAAPIAELLNRVGEPVHLVGHSYGGAVALHIARTRPAMLRSLTLVEPSAFHLLRGGDATDAAALREIGEVAAQTKSALEDGDHFGGFGRFVDYWSGPGSWTAMPADKRQVFAPQLAKVALDFHAILSEAAGLDDLLHVRMPTLLVQGGCTKLPSRCVVSRLRAAIPTAPLRIVQGAGHMLPVTHRDQVNAFVASHIEGHGAVALREAA
jgi:pimeloyl-ACP methyl ester carboxylesterase